MKTIKEYCKTYKVKFIKETNTGFICAIKSNIKARQSFSEKPKIINRVTFYDMLVYNHGNYIDVVFNGKINL